MNRVTVALLVYTTMHIQFIAIAEEHWNEHRFWIAFGLTVWALSSPTKDTSS